MGNVRNTLAKYKFFVAFYREAVQILDPPEEDVDEKHGNNNNEARCDGGDAE